MDGLIEVKELKVFGIGSKSPRGRFITVCPTRLYDWVVVHRLFETLITKKLAVTFHQRNATDTHLLSFLLLASFQGFHDITLSSDIPRGRKLLMHD